MHTISALLPVLFNCCVLSSSRRRIDLTRMRKLEHGTLCLLKLSVVIRNCMFCEAKNVITVADSIDEIKCLDVE